MLKKCIAVPQKQTEEEEKLFAEHPFKRGSMKFDDFNYKVYNEYILVEDTLTELARKAGKSRSSTM